MKFSAEATDYRLLHFISLYDIALAYLDVQIKFGDFGILQ